MFSPTAMAGAPMPPLGAAALAELSAFPPSSEVTHTNGDTIEVLKEEPKAELMEALQV